MKSIKIKSANERLSKAMIRKKENSNYWREQSLSATTINVQANKLVQRKDVKIIKVNSTIESKTSFSTIINSKGVIIVD